MSVVELTHMMKQILFFTEQNGIIKDLINIFLVIYFFKQLSSLLNV